METYSPGGQAGSSSRIENYLGFPTGISGNELAGRAYTQTQNLLETNILGVFVVGDVRAGNIKRVASAVGEGSIAISFVHQLLRE